MNNFVWANDNPRQRLPKQQYRLTHQAAQRQLRQREFRQFGPGRPRPWPIATRRSTSTIRCRSPTTPTSRSARSGSATPTSSSRRSCRPGPSTPPEELAQLSQYVINIVDFRDPDCTMTHWSQSRRRILCSGRSRDYLHPRPDIHDRSTTRCPPQPRDVPARTSTEWSTTRSPSTRPWPTRSCRNVGRPTGSYVELVNTLTPVLRRTADNTLAADQPAEPSVLTCGFQSTCSDPGANNYWDLVITADDRSAAPTRSPASCCRSARRFIAAPIPLTSAAFGTGANVRSSALPPVPSRRGPPCDATATVYHRQAFQRQRRNADGQIWHRFYSVPPATRRPGTRPSLQSDQTLCLRSTRSAIGRPPGSTDTRGVLPNHATGRPRSWPIRPSSRRDPQVSRWKGLLLGLPPPARQPDPDPTVRGPNNPMIVVDADAFPLHRRGGKVTSISRTKPRMVRSRHGSNTMYSVQRPSPTEAGMRYLPGDTSTTTLGRRSIRPMAIASRSVAPVTTASGSGGDLEQGNSRTPDC